MKSYNDNFNHDKDKMPVYDSFVDSIEEEIRKENYQKLWNKYGKLISTIVIVALLGVVGNSLWQKRDLSEKEAISAQFTVAQDALNAGKTEQALTHFKEIGKGKKINYATLAKFEYAAMLADKNDKKAIEQYKLMYEDKHVPSLFRDLAYIYYVNSSLELLDSNELKKELPNFIKELNDNYIGKKWDFLARESLGYCYIKQCDYQNAKRVFSELAKMEKIPSGMLERTREIIQYLNQLYK